MKLIEKLAEAWFLRNRDLNLEGEGVFSQSEAFEAGFRACRQLLLERDPGRRWVEIPADELAEFGEK